MDSSKFAVRDVVTYDVKRIMFELMVEISTKLQRCNTHEVTARHERTRVNIVLCPAVGYIFVASISLLSLGIMVSSRFYINLCSCMDLPLFCWYFSQLPS